MEDKLFAKWDGWIVKLDALLNELILHRYIYQEVRKMVLANPRVAKANHFYEWLYYVHGINMAVAIRKLTDPDDHTITVRSFLEAIKRNPRVLSRSRYKGKFLDDVYTDVEADRYLDKLLGVGHDWIDVAKIDEQIQELESKTSRIKAYVDKVVAHLDRKAPTAIPAIKEGDEAIDYMVQVVDLYYPYFRGIDPGNREPNLLYDWKEIFRYPWIPGEQAGEEAQGNTESQGRQCLLMLLGGFILGIAIKKLIDQLTA